MLFLSAITEGLAMSEEWLNDARKIPDEVMSYLRKMAVRAIEDKKFRTPGFVRGRLGNWPSYLVGH